MNHQELKIFEDARKEYETDRAYEMKEMLEDVDLAEHCLQGAINECEEEWWTLELLERVTLVRKYCAECLEGIYSPEVARSMIFYLVNPPA
jgi:hypothetical protein|tara:strand:+ start:974 stop:1246 length:273 start_codon:yes stop_codon:yes gene_type:complete